MANLSITLSNLLKSLNYQYAAAAKKQSSKSNTTTSSASSSKSSSTTNKTTSTTSAAKTSTTSATVSSLSKLLNNLSKATSVLSNTSVITNDMVTEFFKSYKNSTMTSIYNKLQNGSSMTETDLANFKAQVAKLSTDEQKLWKSEIANIEKQISSKISTTSSSSSTSTVLNGIVSGVLYKDGLKYTGTYTDGKYYNNGVLANGTINGKTYENGVVVSNATTTTSSTTSTANTSSKDLTVTRTTTNSNGNILGYNASGKLVYLEKTVDGKKVVYTDELTYINAKTRSYLTSVKDAVLSDRVLSDIKIVKNAESAGLKAGAEGSDAYKKAYNASIKSQMIKTSSTGTAGEVVEQNGSLYVNDGNKLVKLNISSDTYLKLFAPVERYDINQGSIGDCYFVSGCLTDMMKNGKTYAQLLQMFSEDSNGNITVKFSGSLGNYPVTFENGNLKVMDGKVGSTTVKKYSNASGSIGTKMLEQAYSIANFASENNRTVNSIDIDETLSSIEGGWQYNVYNEVLGEKSERTAIDANSVASYLNSMASKVNNGEVLFSFANYADMSQYSLIYAHAYSIEKIDTAKQMVYITNPWFSGGAIAISYSDFSKVAYSKNNKIYFNLGYVNS